MDNEREFRTKMINHLINVVDGALSSGASTSQIVNVGAGVSEIVVALPVNTSNGVVTVEAWYGKDASGTDVYVDVTNTYFGAATLATKGYYPCRLIDADAYYEKVVFPKIKVKYLASDASNTGVVNLLLRV